MALEREYHVRWASGDSPPEEIVRAADARREIRARQEARAAQRAAIALVPRRRKHPAPPGPSWIEEWAAGGPPPSWLLDWAQGFYTNEDVAPYRKLAAAVIASAIKDAGRVPGRRDPMGWEGEAARSKRRRAAVAFLSSDMPETRRIREFWCSFLGLDPDMLRQALSPEADNRQFIRLEHERARMEFEIGQARERILQVTL